MPTNTFVEELHKDIDSIISQILKNDGYAVHSSDPKKIGLYHTATDEGMLKIGQLNEILKTKIHRVNVSITKQGNIIEYMVDSGTAGYCYSEDRLFSSVEDCKKMYFQEALLNHNSEIERIETLPVKDTINI